MDLSVQKLSNVRDGGGPPGVHGAVHEVEVGDPVVGEEDGQEEVEDWSLCQGGGEGQLTGGPAVAEQDLDDGGEAAGRGCHHGVVTDLGPAGVDWVHLVLVELGLEGGEVEEPVPAPADDEGG